MTTLTAAELFNAFKYSSQLSCRDDGDEKAKYSAYVHEHTDKIYEQFCINEILETSDELSLSVKLIRLLNGLPECPLIPCTVQGPIASIDRNHLHEYIHSTLDLDLSEGEDFSFSTTRDQSLQESGLLGLDRLAAFHGSHLGRRSLLLKEPAKERTEAEKVTVVPDEFKCFSCLDIMKDPATLPCGHSGCLSCLKTIFRSDYKRCPLCNKVYNHQVLNSLAVSIHLRTAINLIFPPEQQETAQMQALLLQNFGLQTPLIPDHELWKQALVDPSTERPHKLNLIDSLCKALKTNLPQGPVNTSSKQKINAAISNNACKKLLRRAGCLAEVKPIYDQMRETSRMFLSEIIKRAAVQADDKSTSTITVDTVLASKVFDYTVLGFGGDHSIRYVWSDLIFIVLSQVHPDKRIDPQALSVCNDICSYLMLKIIKTAMQLGNEQEPMAKRFKVLPPDRNNLVPFSVKFHCTEEEAAGWKDYHGVLNEPVRYITYRNVQNATRFLFPGDIAKYAVAEGGKARDKFMKQRGSYTSTATMSEKSDLVIDFEILTLLVSRASNGYPVEETAIVHLAAVVEYIIAEILELGGNVAGDLGLTAVTCRHIMVGIKCEEELNALFPKCIFRDGGVVPHIHQQLLERITDDEIDSETLDECYLSPFEQILKDKLQTFDTPTCFIDPRTGLHSYFSDSESPVDEKSLLRLAPLLDMMCKETITERRNIARQLLSAEELTMMKSEGSFLCSDQNSTCKETTKNGWSEPCLGDLHRRNLSDIRKMQRSYNKILNPRCFGLLVEDIGNEFEKDFTAEAMECIQTITEGYLIDLIKCSVLNAIHSGNTVLTVRDFESARKIRCELDY